MSTTSFNVIIVLNVGTDAVARKGTGTNHGLERNMFLEEMLCKNTLCSDCSSSSDGTSSAIDADHRESTGRSKQTSNTDDRLNETRGNRPRDKNGVRACVVT